MNRGAWVLVGLWACVAPPPEPDPPLREPVEPPALPPPETSSRRTALAIEVSSVPESLGRLEEALVARGGYVSDKESPERRTDGRRSAVIAFSGDLRQADAMLALLHQLGTPLATNQAVTDMTAEMVQANARLAALRETEARLRGILSEPTTTCADRVAAETEHARVLREMAELAAQVKVLEFRSQYAAFAVRLVEPAPPTTASPEGRSILRRVPAAWTRIARDPAGALADGAVATLASVPWVLALLAIGRGACRIRRRRDGREEPPAG
ncbi:MAG TPA: DUF4349 domain-containing protein [Myxococcota bacterium]|nr:DUF4349 domain-containing protein [Myxococcota bacterium]HQK51745.1 DUF4349 domain-containing protein [Myxococcota bacterium]